MNFTDKQGTMRFEVFPFKFVTREKVFKVHVEHEFFKSSCVKRDQNLPFYYSPYKA